MQRVAVVDGCWIWQGARNREGYGIVRRGKVRLAHRLVWEELIGPIPDGLVSDHLCRQPACVNPNHIELVSDRTNILRGAGVAAVNARKTHCVRGHLLPVGRLRRCETCARIRSHQHYLKRRRERGAAA